MYHLNTLDQKVLMLNQVLLKALFKADESPPAYEPWARSFCLHQRNIAGLHQFKVIKQEKTTNNQILEREFMSI